MKRLIAFATAAFFLVSCGNQPQSESTEELALDSTAVVEDKIEENFSYEMGVPYVITSSYDSLTQGLGSEPSSFDEILYFQCFYTTEMINGFSIDSTGFGSMDTSLLELNLGGQNYYCWLISLPLSSFISPSMANTNPVEGNVLTEIFSYVNKQENPINVPIIIAIPEGKMSGEVNTFSLIYSIEGGPEGTKSKKKFIKSR